MSTSSTNRARVGDALDLLFKVLRPFVEQEMRAVYEDKWLREARTALHGKPPARWDTSDLLTLIYFKYYHVFNSLGHDGRSWVSILKEVRKKWAHQGDLTLVETRRTLETTLLLLRAVGAEAEAAILEPQVHDLMRLELQERLEDPASTPPDRTAVPDEAVEPAYPTNGTGLLGKGLRKVRALIQKSPPEPLELRRDVLDAVEQTAAPHRKHFRFNRLIVHVLALDEQARLLYQAAFDAPGATFADAVRQRLADARIDVPPGLYIGWKLHRTIPKSRREQFEDKPVYVELRRRRVSTSATLTVLRGKTRRNRYTIKSGITTHVGRLKEVVDARGRLVRRNTIAFQDYEDKRLREVDRQIHETVSRVHARIQFDEAEGVFRVQDEQSTCGTSIVREGYPVPIQVKQQPVTLQDGDLVYFGKACVRFQTGRPGK